MPHAESEETDCRKVSGYTSGPVPDTCTVPLSLNDTETEMISWLKDKYQDFPIRCRVGKYTFQSKYVVTFHSILCICFLIIFCSFYFI